MCMCALLASMAAVHDRAVFSMHGTNVARASATGVEHGMPYSNLSKFGQILAEGEIADLACVNGGVNGMESTSPSKREQFMGSSLCV